ncbi:unnamed protein product [Arabis nemorensis]|uniref:Uncharacterized protein n=1 Tax=Arabis nemorensis TaxID=586526 RepID=A0A565B6F0_9BRAS|nr:unnamed protein product [Arabis nemorensis]
MKQSAKLHNHINKRNALIPGYYKYGSKDKDFSLFWELQFDAVVMVIWIPAVAVPTVMVI